MADNINNNSPHPPQPSIGHVFLARIWLFQAVVAAPTFVLLGMLAIANMYNTYDTIYDFVTHLCTAVLAAGIIFVVLVQRQLPGAGKQLTFYLEVAKSALATALWLWLMGDAIWGPISHGGYRRDRTLRIVASAISSVLLFILFYPTAIYTARENGLWSQQAQTDDGPTRDAGEREPLLESRGG